MNLQNQVPFKKWPADKESRKAFLSQQMMGQRECVRI